jgi:hypothetical protein
MSDELTELVDAEIFVDGAEDPGEEQRLLALLDGHAGIAELAIAHGRVDVRYDPIAVNKAEIVRIIGAAGFKVTEVESAAASPITDSEMPDDESGKSPGTNVTAQQG